MKGLIFFIAIINFQTTLAQCNVNTVIQDSSQIFSNSPEKIFENEDLENGILNYHLSIFKKVQKNTKQESYFLESFYTFSLSQIEIVPRILIFTFTDGQNLKIISHTETNSVNKPGDSYKRRRFLYGLTTADFNLLKVKEIGKIEIVDNRTEKSITTKPYKKLIIEQIECLSIYH